MNGKNHSIKKRGRCKACDAEFVIASDVFPKFCPFCGVSLQKNSSFTTQADSEKGYSQTDPTGLSLVSGHEITPSAVQYSIGPYQVVKSIGKGGMGEVLLAYDTTCGRQIALKRIRPDLLKFKQISNRFLKEARVTSQLTHPAIIPIYSIHQENDLTYYTMPFVEGETLKQMLKRAKDLSKKGELQQEILSFASIPQLVRIFLSVCQAINYAHSKEVLHRDIKPENVIVGRFGEVLILDWGLAKLIKTEDEKEDEEDPLPKEINPLHHITLAGKVVGTVSYMAPERALGQPATIQTDIYSLGVILYQILTLKLPFRRGTLKEFRENLHNETLPDPTVIAPYREIPKILSTITLKCLNQDPSLRYSTVDELIKDIEGYIEGRSEWMEGGTLNVNKKTDWEFQENILIAEHTAITRVAEISEWVHLMISKSSFAENILIETELTLGKKSHGIGLLFNIPEAPERESLNDGFCLWLSSNKEYPSKLLRTSIEVLPLNEIYLENQVPYKIKIEKIDHTITLCINGKELFSYIFRTPITGTHIGVLSRDADYKMKEIKVSLKSQNIMVNCLSIPDAFLAHKEYQEALSEYRRIASAFPGRAEGREAVLRSGITLLEQAKNTTVIKEAEALFEASLKEFEKLHGTAGAPLEYLGKALVYEALKDIDEEIKCYELAFRKFPNHPLLYLLKEQIAFRLIESSKSDRKATYYFLLLSLYHIKDVEKLPDILPLIDRLTSHWEQLNFLPPLKNLTTSSKKEALIIILSFWLDRPFIIEECLEPLINDPKKDENAFYALLALYALKGEVEVESFLQKLDPTLYKEEVTLLKPLLEKTIQDKLKKALLMLGQDKRIEPIITLLIDEAIDNGEFNLLDSLFPILKPKSGSSNSQSPLTFDSQDVFCEKSAHQFGCTDSPQKRLQSQISADIGHCNHPIQVKMNDELLQKKVWALLALKKFEQAGEIFDLLPIETLSHETTLWHYLYGIYLEAVEGSEIAKIHWLGVLDISFPRTWMLGSYAMAEKLSPLWEKRAFSYEKKQLERQLKLTP